MATPEYAVHVMAPRSSRSHPLPLANKGSTPTVVVLRRHPADAWWIWALAAGWLVVLVALVVTALNPVAPEGDDLMRGATAVSPLFAVVWGLGGLMLALHPTIEWRSCFQWEVADKVSTEDAARAVLHIPETPTGYPHEPLWVRLVPKEAARRLAALESAAEREDWHARQKALEQRVEEEQDQEQRASERRSRAIERAAEPDAT